MATRISYASGNLTGATTWKTSEAGSGAEAMIRNNTTTLASNTTVTSPAFTITNADVIEGVMLWLYANQATPAGTLTVNILKSGVSQAAVTVNCADLPHSATGTNDVLAVVPVFFRFTSTATGDGTANWTINMVTSNVAGAQITYSRNSGTTGDFTKALRTSTTVSAAAGDDLYVLGELTGAGTHTAFTVTMDSTAATAYGNNTINSTAANGGGLRISNYGTLNYGTVASTNYVLRINGDVEVFWNGTLQIGVSGTEIPRSSSAVLELLMNSASGDFGLLCRNLSTITAAGLSRTVGKDVYTCKLSADAAATNTSLTVNTDTGWLNGDAICIASTTRTVGDCETVSLTANATSSGLTVGAIANAHSGTAPFQGEIGLLTRNVKIRSTSSTNLSYVYMEPLASINLTRTELYNLGSNNTVKLGIYMIDATVQTAKTIDRCSIHDGYIGFRGNNTLSGASYNLTLTNNVVWNMNQQGIYIAPGNSLPPSDYTCSGNLVIKTGQQGLLSFNFSGTINNNTIVGASVEGIRHNDPNSESDGAYNIGSFSGNVAHSNGTKGLFMVGGFPIGSINNFTAWRNNDAGIHFNSQAQVNTNYLTVDNPTLFGNLNQNILWPAYLGDILVINGGTLAGDTTFTTIAGIKGNTNGWAQNVSLYCNGTDFSGTGTGLAAHSTYDLDIHVYNLYLETFSVFNGCKFGAPTPVYLTKTFWAAHAFIGFEKYNNTAGDHRTEMTYGQIKTDTTIFNNASPSMRLTPNSATNKLESAPRYNGRTGILVAVPNGASANVSAYVRKSVVGDGAAYNGNQPRMIVKRNDSIGVTADTVLATYSAANGSWNQMIGTTPVATDAGVFEIIFDCDGTAGWINIDDVTAA